MWQVLAIRKYTIKIALCICHHQIILGGKGGEGRGGGGALPFEKKKRRLGTRYSVLKYWQREPECTEQPTPGGCEKKVNAERSQSLLGTTNLFRKLRREESAAKERTKAKTLLILHFF